MELHLTSTAPKKDEKFWNIDIFPVFNIARCKRSEDKTGGYTAIGLQWLFWAITIIIID